MKKSTYRILAKDHLMSNNTWETGLNNNDIIVGTSGCGKTRGYVIPNILQCNESMIIADVKGYLRKMLARFLEEQGYEVLNINFIEFALSNGYNPLDYIRYDTKREKYNEQDIKTVASGIVVNENKVEPFWELSARMYLESIIAYVMECLPDEEHNLNSAVILFAEMGTGRFERLFIELSELNPSSFAVKQYNMYKNNVKAEKMHESIRGILAEKLSMLTFDGVSEVFNNPKKINFFDMGKRKTILFVTISDTDRSMDRLANLFYTQALHVLCNSADREYEDGRLDIPVRFILDDFATNIYLADFDKSISMIRSREIYVSLILQSLSQLESLYGHAKSMTILNNADNLLYLGGQDVETARYIGIKANKPTCSILNMPLSKAWLFTRGMLPRETLKFELKDHERYSEIQKHSTKIA